MRRVVITGMGIISSLGQGVATFRQALGQGRSGISTVERLKAQNLPICIAAEIAEIATDAAGEPASALTEPLRKRMKQASHRAPLGVRAAAVAAMEAWCDAGLHRQGPDPFSIGLIVAGNNVSQSYQYEAIKKFQEEPAYLSPAYALRFMDTDIVGTLSDVFGIRGEGCTVGGASASGNLGLIQGARLIQSGRADACLVAGALADLSPVEIHAFYSIGAMGGRRFSSSPEKACRPFDRDREGFIYGQASACVVLESEESARRRGATILAEIVGACMGLDGNRQPDPSREGEVRAMSEALREAGLGPGDIQYLNTHGSASPLGDQIEVEAVKQVFNHALKDVRLNSTKSLTGHCLTSAGVVEAVATVIQMREGFLHPNLNLDDPIDEACRFCGPSPEPADIEHAMSNSFGFGGMNSSIIFKRRER
jgi:malonyl-ACP decarboxylase